MKFDELTKLADKVAKNIDEYVSIGVIYNNFPSGTRETRYTFYRERGTSSKIFNTAQDLKAFMENILNPVADEGIDINDMADEDGLLRGAE